MKKTLFEESLDDVFLKSLQKEQRPYTKQRILGDYFQICSSAKDKKYYRYYFELHDHFIFCKKNINENEIAFMDIQNSFMRLTQGTNIQGIPHFGIKFIKKKTYEELFSPDENVIREWYEQLKKFCIMTKFRCYFKTKKVIGKGNFAKVFLVERISDCKEFAVKVFNKKVIMSDPQERKCLLYEIKMMRSMHHHRVLKLYELYEGENFVYCLCELYKGADLLQSIIKKGPQPETKALTIALQILQGLEYMHRQKIIHRDLKPENIIFKNTQNIDIGIVDLGFATYEKDYDKLFKRCGTPGYVAPEILNDKPYDCKVDIYSCGIILYIILTGVVPFSGNSYKQIVYKNMKANIDFEIPKKMNFSQETIDLLQAMLERDPVKRISSKQSLNHPCFHTMLSVSPLILKPSYNAYSLQEHQKITQQEKQKKKHADMPNRIEDLSPSPIPNKRPKSPFLYKYDKFGYKQFKYFQI